MPGVPLPTIRLGEPAFIGGGSSDEPEEHEEHELVVLKRRAHVRSFTFTGHNIVADKPQEGPGKIHAIDTGGETVVQIEGLGHTDSNVVLDRKCLISLNWPAAKWVEI